MQSIYENVCICGCMKKGNETQKDLENRQQNQLATY